MRLPKFVSELARRDDGLSFMIVAVTLVALVGMVAFAVDAGAMYAERRELQNGAEAAVLAIAEDCARGLPCDTTRANATADLYADANARRDGAAGIHSIDLDTSENTVTVRTQTETPGGTTVLAPLFAQVIGYSGDTIGAKASAQWGYASSAYGIPPLVISECEWNKILDQGGGSALNPVVFLFHDGNSTEDCNAQAGQDYNEDNRLPGGFGWAVANGSALCTMDVPYIPGWVAFEDPGASPSNGCSASVLRDLIYQQDIVLPYFTDVRGLGAGGEYYLQALGGFHVTGYNFGGQYKQPSPSQAPCSGDQRCIAGYVTAVSVPLGDIGGEDRGAILWKLTG